MQMFASMVGVTYYEVKKNEMEHLEQEPNPNHGNWN